MMGKRVPVERYLACAIVVTHGPDPAPDGQQSVTAHRLVFSLPERRADSRSPTGAVPPVDNGSIMTSRQTILLGIARAGGEPEDSPDLVAELPGGELTFSSL